MGIIASFFFICIIITYRGIRNLPQLAGAAKTSQPKKTNVKLDQALSYAARLYSEHHYLAAEKAYLEVVKLDHGNVIAYNRLGRIYLSLKNYSDAIECCQIAAQRSPSPSTYFNLGTAFYENKNYSKAIGAYQESLAREPSASRYAGLAKAYQRQANWPKAVEAFEKAAEIDPSLHYKQTLLTAYYASNNLEKAKNLQLEMSKPVKKIP